VPGVDDLSKVRVFFDYRELFEKMGDELDAAVIATPNHHHALAAVMAMRRGIHVFVEKPLASTVEEAQLMGRVKDGIPYDKEHVGRTGVCHKREFQNLPPIIEEMEREYGLAKAPFLNMGTLFVGTKGKIWFSHHSAIRFFPRTLGREIVKSKRFTYKTAEHTLEFYRAIREQREANTNFDYSVPLATAVLLGNVAARAGKKKLLWDGTRITNDDVANAYLRTAYRKGWELT